VGESGRLGMGEVSVGDRSTCIIGTSSGTLIESWAGGIEDRTGEGGGFVVAVPLPDATKVTYMFSVST